MSGKIWWTNLSNPSRLITDISDALICNESVILNIDRELPFYGDFSKALKNILNRKNSSRGVETVDLTGCSSDPGEYFLENYCNSDTRDGFSPLMAPEDHLAGASGFKLNGNIVLLKATPADKADKWQSFISSFSKKNNPNKAVFLLELRGAERVPKPAKHCRTISSSAYYFEFDHYVYCYMLASEIKECKKDIMKQYIAELVCTLCRGRPEMCSSMFAYGTEIAEDPAGVAGKVSGGAVNEVEVMSAVWQVQNKMLFPIIEQFRRTVVEKHLDEIKSSLPFRTPYGVEINEPFELDLGNLKKMDETGKINIMDRKDTDMLWKYCDIRNDLAHMRPTEYKNLEYFSML